MALLHRQALLAPLAAHAARPLRGHRTALPAFFASWLVSGLAPQLLAATAVDGVRAVRREPAGPRRTAGLALAGASAAALARATLAAQGDRTLLDRGLAAGALPDDEPDAAELVGPRWAHLARPFHMGEAGVRVERDVAYAAGGRRARLDVYLPDRPVRDAPVLVQVHGGAWTVGSKREQGLALMHRMARRGWICVAPNYRLAPRHRWPTQAVDVKRALAWVHEHVADWGGDPSYVAVTGGSAGGHLAALAALTAGDPALQPGFEDADTSVVAAVPFYGVYDLAAATGTADATALRDGFLARRVFPPPWSADPEAYRAASPLLRVPDDGSALPDFLLLHGGRDSLVDVEQARAFAARLREAGTGVTYVEMPGAQHAFDVFWSVRTLHVVDAVDRWLRRHRSRWLAAGGGQEATATG